MAVSLKDLGTVLDETFAARSKWYYIGLKLGMEASELDAIKKDNAEAVKDCYLEALKCWLKGVAPKPTWAALAEALASDMVDEGGLAEKLREKYCPSTDKSPNVGGKALRFQRWGLRDKLLYNCYWELAQCIISFRPELWIEKRSSRVERLS